MGLLGRKTENYPPLSVCFIFTLLLIFCYGGVWLLFQGVEPVYTEALAIGGELYYAIEGKKLHFFVEGHSLVFRSYSRPGFEARLSPEGIYSNTVFLLTLIFVTPGMRLNRRGIYLGISVVLLYLVHVVFLVTKVEVSLVASRHPLAGSTFFWESADNFLEIMGKALFPILIWLLLTLYYMMGAVDAIPSRLSGKRPGRNDPCPCGSGRKYKYCCGSR